MKQLKRTFSALLAALCLISVCPVLSLAAQPDDVSVQPRLTGVASMSAGLDIRTVGNAIGLATCTGFANLYSGFSAEIVVELKKDGLTIKSWSDTTSSMCEVAGTYYVASGYTYWVKTTVYVYNSSNVLVATETEYSPSWDY